MIIAVKNRDNKFVILIDFIQQGPEYSSQNIAEQEANKIKSLAESRHIKVTMYQEK